MCGSAKNRCPAGPFFGFRPSSTCKQLLLLKHLSLRIGTPNATANEPPSGESPVWLQTPEKLPVGARSNETTTSKTGLPAYLTKDKTSDGSQAFRMTLPTHTGSRTRNHSLRAVVAPGSSLVRFAGGIPRPRRGRASRCPYNLSLPPASCHNAVTYLSPRQRLAVARLANDELPPRSDVKRGNGPHRPAAFAPASCRLQTIAGMSLAVR